MSWRLAFAAQVCGSPVMQTRNTPTLALSLLLTHCAPVVEGTGAASDTTSATTVGTTSPTTSTATVGDSSSSSTTGSTSTPVGTDPTELTQAPTSATTDVELSSTSTGSTSEPSEATTSETSGLRDAGAPAGVYLIVEGLGMFPTVCLDQDCGAREACQRVTGKDCTWVPYDALNTNVGSYVTNEYKANPADFSFGLYPLTNNFGNISSCLEIDQAKALLTGYGVAVTYQWCGLGQWYLKQL